MIPPLNRDQEIMPRFDNANGAFKLEELWLGPDIRQYCDESM